MEAFLSTVGAGNWPGRHNFQPYRAAKDLTQQCPSPPLCTMI